MISRALKDKARAARPTFTGQNLRLHQNVALLMPNRRATEIIMPLHFSTAWRIAVASRSAVIDCVVDVCLDNIMSGFFTPFPCIFSNLVYG